MLLRIRYLFLFALLAGCTSPQLEPAPVYVRLMTFNIRYNNPGDGEDAWPNRIDKVESMIRFHDAHIAGLQEAQRGQIDDLADRLQEFDWFGVGRDDGADGGEFTPIFYLKDKFELLRQDTFWLSEQPEVPGSKSWDAAITRIATWGIFRDRQTGDSLFVLNTHFDHIGVTAREESAKLIVSRLDSLSSGLPIVVMGDFNATDDTAPYKTMSSELRDAFHESEQAHHGPTTTWNGFTAIEPNRRIDYIFVRGGVQVLRHGILSDTFDGRFPSDHLPVLAEVAFP